jgi:hypothetical protein
MKDQEALLRQFEPVLCFAGRQGRPKRGGGVEAEIRGEQFFPMDVKPYLAASQLWIRRKWLPPWLFPQNVTQLWDQRARELAGSEPNGTARSTALATLENSGRDYFVRFVQPSDIDETRRRADEQFQKTSTPPGSMTYVRGMLLANLVLILLVGSTTYANASNWRVVGTAGFILSVVLTFVIFYMAALLDPDQARIGCAGLVANTAILCGAIGVAVWGWDVTPSRSRELIIGSVEITCVVLVASLAVYLSEALPERRARELYETVAGVRALLFASVAFAVGIPRFQRYIYAAGGILILVYLVGPYAIRKGGLREGVEFIQALYAAFLRKPALGAARAAARKYNALKSEPGARAQHTYYGRVWQDTRHPGKIVLQYFYFYAYNDWGNQGGVNFHEGDWEAVFVYLNDDGAGAFTPDYVGISQHHTGDARPWEEVERYVDREGRSHPVIYPAAGSHANYFCDNIGRMSPFGKETAGIWSYTAGDGTMVSEPAVVSTQRWGGMPLEFPNGLGEVIGKGKPTHSLSLSEAQPWSVVVLEDDRPRWLDFRGLWGSKKPLHDESGPTGPKWNRPRTWWQRVQCAWERRRLGLWGRHKARIAACEELRLYWHAPLAWLDLALQRHQHRRAKGTDPCDTGPTPERVFVTVGQKRDADVPPAEAHASRERSSSETAAWRETSWGDPDALQAFLNRFPDGYWAPQAIFLRTLQRRMGAIRSGGILPDLVITFEQLGPRWHSWKRGLSIKEEPDVGVIAYHLDQTGFFGAIPDPDQPGPNAIIYDAYGVPMTYTGDGSLVIFETNGLELEYINSIVIQSLEGEALYFGVIEGMGLVHLHGRGRVGIPSSQAVSPPAAD